MRDDFQKNRREQYAVRDDDVMVKHYRCTEGLAGLRNEHAASVQNNPTGY